MERVSNAMETVTLKAALCQLLTEDEFEECIALLRQKTRVSKHCIFYEIALQLRHQGKINANADMVARYLSRSKVVAKVVLSQKRTPHLRHLHKRLRDKLQHAGERAAKRARHDTNS